MSIDAEDFLGRSSLTSIRPPAFQFAPGKTLKLQIDEFGTCIRQAANELLEGFQTTSDPHFAEAIEEDSPTSQLLEAIKGIPISGSYIISESELETFTANAVFYESTYEFDLSNPDDVARFEEQFPEIQQEAQSGNTIIVIRNLNTLSATTHGMQGQYRILHYLRTLEESVGGRSMFITTIPVGARLPEFTVTEYSSFGLQSLKIGFSSTRTWKITEGKRIDERPKRSLDAIEGRERRAYYEQLIERVYNGENIIFRGLRRGGKTSLRHTALEIYDRRADVETRPMHHTQQAIGLIRQALINDIFIGLSEEDQQALKACPDRHLVTEANKLLAKGRKLSGKKIIIDGDECLEQHLTGTDINLLMTFYEIAKDLRESAIPISFLIVVTSNVYPIIARQIEDHHENTRDAHLSAFAVERVGLLTEPEARELLTRLFVDADLQFPTDADREACFEQGIQLCSNSVETLRIYVNEVASCKEGQSIIRCIEQYTTGLFEQYMSFMTPIERDIITTLCLAQGHNIRLDYRKYQREIEDLKADNYIEVKPLDQGGNEVQITLLARGFIPTVIGILDKIITEHASETSTQYAQEILGVTEQDLDLLLEDIIDLTPEQTKRYEAVEILLKKAKEEIKTHLFAFAQRGMIDINTYGKFQEIDRETPGRIAL